jgi:hypothetical protein
LARKTEKMEGEEDLSGVSDSQAVRVFVRIRPLNRRELEEKQVIGWGFTENCMLEDTQNGQRAYNSIY